MAHNPKPIRKMKKKFFRNHHHPGYALATRVFTRFDRHVDTFILYKRKPIPVNLLTWGIWMEKSRARVVKQTMLPGGVKVSTVFLGLNHGWGGQVLLFETMIFQGENGGYCYRYATYDEALEGHQKAIEEVFKVEFNEEV